MAAAFDPLYKQNQTLLLEVFVGMESWLERLFVRASQGGIDYDPDFQGSGF